MKRTYVLLLYFLLTSLFFAQNNYDVNQFVKEGRNYYSSFTNWNETDILKLVLTGGITYGIFHYDNVLDKQIKKPEWFGSSGAAMIGRLYGEPLTPILLGSYFYIHGNSTGNKVNKKLGFEIAQATFYSFTVTTLLKYLFGRERPGTAISHYEFHPLSFRNNDFLSLPSGHTTIAFAMSTVFSKNADTKFWQIASYIPALITAASRMYENRHWASDVFLGAVIGYFSAEFFVKKHDDDNLVMPRQPEELFNISIPLN